MKIWITKELFQWEKNREVYISTESSDPEISCLQFYNAKSDKAIKVDIKNNKALFPNSLLKEKLPIMVLVCTGEEDNRQVISRRQFRVIARTKPEDYIDEQTQKEIIYDGGEEL